MRGVRCEARGERCEARGEKWEVGGERREARAATLPATCSLETVRSVCSRICRSVSKRTPTAASTCFEMSRQRRSASCMPPDISSRTDSMCLRSRKKALAGSAPVEAARSGSRGGGCVTSGPVSHPGIIKPLTPAGCAQRRHSSRARALPKGQRLTVLHASVRPSRARRART